MRSSTGLCSYTLVSGLVDADSGGRERASGFCNDFYSVTCAFAKGQLVLVHEYDLLYSLSSLDNADTPEEGVCGRMSTPCAGSPSCTSGNALSMLGGSSVLALLRVRLRQTRK